MRLVSASPLVLLLVLLGTAGAQAAPVADPAAPVALEQPAPPVPAPAVEVPGSTSARPAELASAPGAPVAHRQRLPRRERLHPYRRHAWIPAVPALVGLGTALYLNEASNDLTRPANQRTWLGRSSTGLGLVSLGLAGATGYMLFHQAPARPSLSLPPRGRGLLLGISGAF